MNFRGAVAALPLLFVLACHAWAGGSGLNVVIVVNQASSNSVHLGNYYAEQRQVPPQNYLRIHWTGNAAFWSYEEFESALLNPLLGMVRGRLLTNQVDYVALSMDIPYRIVRTGSASVAGENSTTSALYYGFKSDFAVPSYNPASCNLPAPSSNSYAGSEGVFRLSRPGTAPTNSFMAMMITSSNIGLARAIIDHGVASDGTFSPQTVILSKSTDPARNVRFYAFDNALFNARLRGDYSMIRTNSNDPYAFSNLLGYQGGHYRFSIRPDTFVPGAMADSLTSYGGRIYEVNDHTTLLAFLDAGASGSYGTIVEPCNYLEKFPSPQTYFYQARGFSLAECYYQSITNPYQGLLVGEPLAAPFARPPAASWNGLPPCAALAGSTNLLLAATASEPGRPVQQIDLFVDGLYAQTLTNIAPQPGNLLSVNIRGQSISYAVPGGGSIESVVNGLAAQINLPSHTNNTKVRAFPHGDRIELRSFDDSTPGSGVAISATSSSDPGAALTTFISASGGAFLDTVASGIRSYGLSGNPVAGSFLQLLLTKTNGTELTFAVTNHSGALSLFQMVQELVSAVNGHPALSGPDGLRGQDLFDTSPWTPTQTAQFNFIPNTAGWGAARIQVVLTASAEVTVDPASPETLEQNLADLQPRAHLYVTAGLSDLVLTFPIDTTRLADGYHQLAAVVYEGSHVRTQQRVLQDIVVRNRNLTAVMTTLMGGSNTAIEATLQFHVAANTNDIAHIELVSTGGVVASAAGQGDATLPVSAAYLGEGLHPFYAIVTAASGEQYQTETRWIRILADEQPFLIHSSPLPLTLIWPALAGRSYDVLMRTNLTGSFQVNARLTPTNSVGIWADTNAATAWRFYRVRSSQ